MAKLEIKNLSVSSKDQLLLEDISFSVNSGELNVVTGPRNSGIEELQKVLIGENKKWNGTVSFNGSCMTEISKRVVTVDYPIDSTHKKITVLDYLAIPCKVFGKMNIEDDNSIKDIVSFFNCKTLLDLKLESLSIGQLLKVKLMKAYLASPFVLIIDQPFYRLTNTERLEVLSAIKEMKEHMSKIAIVIFCQYVKEWFPICNHFVIFSEHKIQQVGTKEELLTQPTNAFVAAFVYGNKISFLRGTVNFGIFTCGKLEFPIPTNIQLPSNLEDLIIAITPDQFVLVDFSTAKVDVEAFIPVYIIEKGIESNYLYSNISGQTIIAEFQKNDRIEEGMLIKVGLSLHNVLLFDGRTKNRLVKKE